MPDYCLIKLLKILVGRHLVVKFEVLVLCVVSHAEEVGLFFNCVAETALHFKHSILLTLL